MKLRQKSRERTLWSFCIVLLIAALFMLPGAALLFGGEDEPTSRVTESARESAAAHPSRSDDVQHDPSASNSAEDAKQRAEIVEWKHIARPRITATTATRVEQPEFPVEVALKKRIPINFENEPLSDVLDAIAKRAGLSIFLDEQGIREEGVTVDSPVTIKLSSPISARSALNHILMPKGLVYRVVGSRIHVTGETRRSTSVFTKNYDIADLVIPIPTYVELPLDGKRRGPQKQKDPDQETLIELITSTIAPRTWDDAGGKCSIVGYPADSSFVVSATRATHDDICDLLEQLRRLQDLQVTLKLETIRVAAGETVVFDGIETDPPMEPVDLMDSLSSEPATLSDVEAEILRQVFQSRETMEVVAGPRVTLLNGQTARIGQPQNSEAPGSEAIYLRPVVTGDRQAVRLAAAVSEKTPDAWEVGAFRSTIADGGSLLMDITRKSVPQDAASRSDKESDSGDRILLLVTSQVIIIEEEYDTPLPPPPPP